MDSGLRSSVDKVLSRLQIPISDLEEPSSYEPYGFEEEPDRKSFWMEQAGVPIRYRKAKMEWVSQKVQPIVSSYCDNLLAMRDEKRGLIVSGPVGTGKSCVLSLVAQAAYHHFCQGEWHRPVVYINCADLYAAMFKKDQRIEDSWYAQVQFLLLDELGTAYDSDFATAQLDALMERRYADECITCVATNLSVKQMKEDLRWRRVYDRLREGAIGIELTGASRRGKQP